MKVLLSAVACCAMVWPSVGQAGAFRTCQAAWNYGWNTGNVYAGSVYNRLACNSADREDTELTLARTMSNYVAASLDRDEHLLCMYSGLYTGLLERASTEYKKCYTTAFRCLRRVTIGQYAIAVLAALYNSVAYPYLLTPQDVSVNFAISSVELSGDSVCGTCDDEACEAAVQDFLEANGLEVDNDLVAQLVESNCACD
jgi:hypothetical protein